MKYQFILPLIFSFKMKTLIDNQHETCTQICYIVQEEFEDTKEVIRILKSEGQTRQWPKEKGQTTIYKA
jgi:hypothetical protein